MSRARCLRGLLILSSVACGSALRAADWPMWRHDRGRTATSAQDLPEDLQLRWSRQLPPLVPAYCDRRLQFDAGYEPVVLGRRLFVGSSFDNSVSAYHCDDGEQLWKFYTDGPVRFAPVAEGDRLLFGSDDGHVYCVAAADGKLLWKFRAAPSGRQLLGNGRLISVWPVRGGPVLSGGCVYFAAGVWPLEGVFVYCLDVATGKVIWENDRTSYIYGQHPHNTEAYGGLAPQGYLLIDGEHLVVPSSSAYPARFDLATGELADFKLPSAGRKPGGWFAASPPGKAERRGLLFDSEVNQTRHEGGPKIEGGVDVRSVVRAGGRELKFEDGFPGVEGEVHSMLAAADCLFVVATDGTIYCFGKPSRDAAKRWPLDRLSAEAQGESKRAQSVLAASGAKHGHAVVFGSFPPAFYETLVRDSSLHVVGIVPEEAAITKLRGLLAGDASRLSFQVGNPGKIELPPYFAELVVVGDEVKIDVASLAGLYRSLRPFGGTLVGSQGGATLAEASDLSGAKITLGALGLPDAALVSKPGALPGSTNYTGGFGESEDQLVKAPLGVLWFDDRVAHFKRAPQPMFIDGVMVSADKDWVDTIQSEDNKIDYPLLGAKFTDVYTGRPLSPIEAPQLRQKYSGNDTSTIQPRQYRPATQKDHWKPGQPRAGTRTNPLTGETEPRVFPKMYGCDGGVDYGNFYTMRSGTAAFYDKRIESGTVNISGPRSGCTNSIIPANGLLNVPYFYKGCSCSYPLPMALALVSMPEGFEQWTSWGQIPAEKLNGKIRRIGINFGAPGDRKTEDGTLWLDYPNIGGPSPELSITSDPAVGDLDFFYHHSTRIGECADAWPWVAGSGVCGLRRFQVGGLRPGEYSVKLVFVARSEKREAFDVSLQGGTLLEGFDVIAHAGGLMRGVGVCAEKIRVGADGLLTLSLSGDSTLSGIELIRADKK